ncbi:hypothetical protein CDL15_Pgr021128 [Punica granatum]|uniref:Uncharacterized protein n=1 Tax=Punica granatum TaxID=22663 RepID=A0A218WLB7_PUNGR|nr:hypothetical protein CDL15_Pgr021128 [Punica granatum]
MLIVGIFFIAGVKSPSSPEMGGGGYSNSESKSNIRPIVDGRDTVEIKIIFFTEGGDALVRQSGKGDGRDTMVFITIVEAR